MTSDVVAEVARRLADPVAVCEQLGLTEGSQRQSSGLLIRCPSHGDRTPSCSVTRGPDGTVRVKCFGCDLAGNVLHLIAAARGLEIRHAFSEVLDAAKEIAGVSGETGAFTRSTHPLPVEPERDYPPAAQVAELWEGAIPVTDDAEASAMLAARGIDPARVAASSLARVLRADAHPSRVPEWARYKGNYAVSRPWTVTGHRLLLPAYDCAGAIRSVRAWRVVDGETPKRLPPGGFRASGLVVANGAGARWLQGRRFSRVVVVEGEPDLLARAIVSPSEAVIGILSGSWHDGFARRVHYGTEVDLLTHLDDAGNRYADQIIRSIGARANVRRWTGAAA